MDRPAQINSLNFTRVLEIMSVLSLCVTQQFVVAFTEANADPHYEDQGSPLFGPWLLAFLLHCRTGPVLLAHILGLSHMLNLLQLPLHLVSCSGPTNSQVKGNFLQVLPKAP